jgi:4-hydroxybenzoate polyprenyltransferase
VFSEFVYGSHLLSIGASGIVLCLLLILDLPIAYQALLIPYLSSQIVYTYNHLSEGSADELSNPERTKHVKKSKRKGYVLLLMYVATLLLVSLTTNIDTVLVLISIVFGGVLYTLALKDFGARYIVGFKNIYTSVFWGMTVLLVPALYQLQLDRQILYFGIFVFLRWVVNSTYFDIKDEISDSKRSLKTFPVVIGRKNTIRLLHLVNLLSIVPIVLGYLSGQYDTEVLIMSLFVVYGFIYLAITSFLREKNVRLLSYIVVDSEYAFWPIAFFLGSLFLG